MTKIQNSKLSLIFIKACQICFGYWIPAPWNFASSEPANGRIPQGENLGFVGNSLLGIWDFIAPHPVDSAMRVHQGKTL